MPQQILAEVTLPDFNDRPGKEGYILRAAEELFMQFGYKKVTVEEICREAGVSKVTFYKYFPNKFAVLENYLTARLKLGWETFDRIRQSTASFQAKMQAIIDMKQSVVTHFSAVFYRSLLEGDPAIQKLLDKWTAMSLDAMKQFFAEGQARGEIDKDYDPDFLLLMVTNLSTVASSEAIQNIYGDDLVKGSRDMMNFLFYGISGPNKGKRS